MFVRARDNLHPESHLQVLRAEHGSGWHFLIPQSDHLTGLQHLLALQDRSEVGSLPSSEANLILATLASE